VTQDEIDALEALERAWLPDHRVTRRTATRRAAARAASARHSRPDDGAPVPEFLLEPRDFDAMPGEAPPWTVERAVRLVLDLDAPLVTLAVVIITSLCTAAVTLALLAR
jgi:hypothetical protein